MTRPQSGIFCRVDSHPEGAAMFGNTQMTFKNALRDATTKVGSVKGLILQSSGTNGFSAEQTRVLNQIHLSLESILVALDAQQSVIEGQQQIKPPGR